MSTHQPSEASAVVAAFLATGSWEDAELLVEQYPVLLSSEADHELVGSIADTEAGGDERAVGALRVRRALLRRCAEIGVTTAFSELRAQLGVESAPVLVKLHDLLTMVHRLSVDEEAELRAQLCRVALSVVPREAEPDAWVELQVQLGRSLLSMPGDHVADVEEAIACLESALAEPDLLLPTRRAAVKGLLANALLERSLGDRSENLERAIAYYQEALLLPEVVAKATWWAELQNNLGNAYLERIVGDRSGNVEQAIACHTAALRIRAEESQELWAMTMCNLGNDYRNRLVGDPGDNVEVAVASYEAALERPLPGSARALALLNLGDALQHRPRGTRAENFERAIAACTAAADLYADHGPRIRWASAQVILAHALTGRVRGDRRTNQEQAIKHYQAALEVIDPAAFPREWADVQANLANLFTDRIEGDRAENMELAIAHHQAALKVRTREALPDLWLHSQINLGRAWCNRIDGHRAENLEQGIACYRAALRVITERGPDVTDWALVQHNLGMALVERERGDHAENLEQAIACFQAALRVFGRDTLPYDWAQTQQALAEALVKRVRGDPRENLGQAIASYEATLTVYGKDSLPHEWATVQQDLGETLLHWQQQRSRSIERAIGCFSNALQVFTQEADPLRWAHATAYMGIAFSNRLTGDRADNVERAIGYLDAALQVLASSPRSRAWASYQVALGGALRERIRGNRATEVERAIGCCRAALEVLARDETPRDWAQAHVSLAGAYLERIRGDRADNLERAIEHFETALEVYTRAELPREWANATGNLGLAYRDRIRGDRVDNLERAIACFTLAMEIQTRESAPWQWATLQNNLAIVHRGRLHGDPSTNARAAIHHFELALQVRTRAEAPLEWAMTQSNLGNAYSTLAQVENRVEHFDRAVSCFESALEVRSAETVPIEWASTQLNLGAALSDRAERVGAIGAEDLDRAIECLEAASSVFTREAFPRRWADCQVNLGSVLMLRYWRRWQHGDTDNDPDLAAAIRHYEAALDVVLQDGGPLARLKVGESLGSACARAGRWEAAADAYASALEAGEELYATSLSRRTRDLELLEARDLHAQAAACLHMMGRPRDAVIALERGRARSLGLTLARDLADLQQVERQAPEAYRAYQEAVAAARELEAIELNRSADDVQPAPEAAEALREQARVAYEGLRNAVGTIRTIEGFESFLLPPSFEEIETAAGQGTPLAYVSSGPAGILIHIVERSSSGIRVQSLQGLGGGEQLVRFTLIGQGRIGPGNPFALPVGTPNERSHLNALLHTVGQSIAMPLWLTLTSIAADAVVLVPCGALVLAPIHAAPFADQDGTTRCLLDFFDISYAPSARVLNQARQRLAEGRGRPPALAGVGNPLPASPPLPFAEAELYVVAQHFRDPRVSVGHEATADRLAADLKDASYLHLACHAVFDPLDPLGSHLQLGNGTRLTLGRILREGFAGECRLVFASACSTAVSEHERTPDELIGLPGGFLQAGTPGVVGTLWPTFDPSAALVAARFYQLHLVGVPEEGERPMSPARALRHAQRWLATATAGELADFAHDWPAVPEGNATAPDGTAIEVRVSDKLTKHGRSHRPFTDPYFWAPFVFVGA